VYRQGERRKREERRGREDRRVEERRKLTARTAPSATPCYLNSCNRFPASNSTFRLDVYRKGGRGREEKRREDKRVE
jgi:hypothetical protein